MYKVNGISLDDPARGWTVLNSSERTAGITIARPTLTIPGRDGGIPLPGYQETPALGLVIGTPRRYLAALKTLLQQPALRLERAGTPGTATVQLDAVSDTVVGAGMDAEMEVKVVLSIPGVWYRGDVEETKGLPVSSGTAVSVFPGLTGKVPDALVRFTDVVNPRVTDSAGSFMAYTGTVPAGSYLTLDAVTGRGYLTGTAKWSGGTEVDPLLIGYGRGPDFLTITPYITTDPDNPSGRLTVTHSGGGTPVIAIRGRNAYLV